jgi:hypothetical protein
MRAGAEGGEPITFPHLAFSNLLILRRIPKFAYKFLQPINERLHQKCHVRYERSREYTCH